MKPGRFVGREAEVRALSDELGDVGSSRRGRFVLVRGRRRVGKSRLVEEFLRREQPPHVFFSATRGRSPQMELQRFTQMVADSSLKAAATVRAGARFDTWDAALALIADVSDPGSPEVVVIDELPYLSEQDPSIEGALQTAWDRHIEAASTLLIAIGSDLSMMEALTEYGRPLYDRPSKVLHLTPLSPAEVAEMLDLDPVSAFDAYTIVGGFPLLAEAWGRAADVRSFLTRELSDSTSPLIVSGERMVSAEFPGSTQARRVLSAIGSGERTFSAISMASGVPRQSLERALDVLVRQKRVVERTVPLSSRGARDARYVVADPYLRFWLRFLEGGLEEVERGRGDLLVARIMGSWHEYRGKAIEPVVREAIARLLPSERFGDARYVGSYWTRRGDVEVDLVGAEEGVRPARIDFVGSIKWRERSPLNDRDVKALRDHAARVPGSDPGTLLIGVSRAGFRGSALDMQLEPRDLLGSWSQ